MAGINTLRGAPASPFLPRWSLPTPPGRTGARRNALAQAGCLSHAPYLLHPRRRLHFGADKGLPDPEQAVHCRFGCITRAGRLPVGVRREKGTQHPVGSRDGRAVGCYLSAPSHPVRGCWQGPPSGGRAGSVFRASFLLKREVYNGNKSNAQSKWSFSRPVSSGAACGGATGACLHATAGGGSMLGVLLLPVGLGGAWGSPEDVGWGAPPRLSFTELCLRDGSSPRPLARARTVSRGGRQAVPVPRSFPALGGYGPEQAPGSPWGCRGGCTAGGGLSLWLRSRSVPSPRTHASTGPVSTVRSHHADPKDAP